MSSLADDALTALSPVLPDPHALITQWRAGIQTDRLILRAPTPGDAEAWAALHADPKVTQHIYAAAMTPEDSWRDLAFTLGHAAMRGFSMWAIETREDGRFIGRVGPWMPQGWPGLEIGWALRPDAQGKGYATLAAKAALTWTARNMPGAAAAIHSLHPSNARSQALVKRLGAQCLGDAHIAGDAYKIWVSDLSAWR